MSKYTPTGFPVGRPRNTDVRPVTPAILKARAFRAENAERLKEYNRIKSAEWRANNPQRRKQLDQNARTRSKALDQWLALESKTQIVTLVTVDA